SEHEAQQWVQTLVAEGIRNLARIIAPRVVDEIEAIVPRGLQNRLDEFGREVLIPSGDLPDQRVRQIRNVFACQNRRPVYWLFNRVGCRWLRGCLPGAE